MNRDMDKENKLGDIFKEIQRDETTIIWQDKISQDLNEDEADNSFLDDAWAQLFPQEDAVVGNLTRNTSRSKQKEKTKNLEVEVNSLVDDDFFIGECKDDEGKTAHSPKKQQCSHEEAMQKEKTRKSEKAQSQTNSINRNGRESEMNITNAKIIEPVLTATIGDRSRQQKKRTFHAPRTTRSKSKSNESPGISDALLADLKELEKVLFGGRPGPRPKLEENNASRNEEQRRKRTTVAGKATKFFTRKLIHLCGGCDSTDGAGSTTPVYYNIYM
jgi:hypothetical protein